MGFIFVHFDLDALRVIIFFLSSLASSFSPMLLVRSKTTSSGSLIAQATRAVAVAEVALACSSRRLGRSSPARSLQRAGELACASRRGRAHLSPPSQIYALKAGHAHRDALGQRASHSGRVACLRGSIA